METIFYIAIFWCIIRWIHNFLIKLISDKWYNTSDILFWNSIFFIIFSIIWIIIFWWEIFDLKLFILFSFLHSFVFFIGNYFNYKAQKEVPNYVFYSISRLRTILLIFVWFIFFNEKLDLTQIFWIILIFLWSFIIMKKDENSLKYHNFNLWIIFSVIALIFYTSSVSLFKSWLETSTILTFILVNYLFTMIFSNITKKIENKYIKYTDKHKLIDYLKTSLILSIFLFTADIIYAYSLKNIEIAINSALSIIATIIPIILATIFLKEKITKTKILALTIILFSIYLLK